MQTFRKKPVEIQAIQWTGDNTSEVIDWVLSTGTRSARWHEAQPAVPNMGGGRCAAVAEHIAIDTLEGTMRADVGDWIIRGVQGEHYPCKPDIFEATYEPVMSGPSSNLDNADIWGPEQPAPAVIDAAHLGRQRDFSHRTFGPGPRTEGVLDHIRKELKEIEAAPDDLSEWVDVVILALDGAWRAGHEPQQIIDAIVAKQAHNESRTWPDWRTAEPGRAIEHDRTV